MSFLLVPALSDLSVPLAPAFSALCFLSPPGSRCSFESVLLPWCAWLRHSPPLRLWWSTQLSLIVNILLACTAFCRLLHVCASSLPLFAPPRRRAVPAWWRCRARCLLGGGARAIAGAARCGRCHHCGCRGGRAGTASHALVLLVLLVTPHASRCPAAALARRCCRRTRAGARARAPSRAGAVGGCRCRCRRTRCGGRAGPASHTLFVF